MPHSKIRYKPFVSQLLQVYKTGLKHQSASHCLPVQFAQVFQREVAQQLLTVLLKRHLLTDMQCHSHGSGSAARAGAGPMPSQLGHCHTQHLVNRSQALSCCFSPYPWSGQDTSTLSELQTTSSSCLLTTVAFHQPLVHEAPQVY